MMPRSWLAGNSFILKEEKRKKNASLFKEREKDGNGEERLKKMKQEKRKNKKWNGRREQDEGENRAWKAGKLND